VHLEGARLLGAHLERANLNGAYLERAKLADAYLDGGTTLHNAHLRSADLFGAQLMNAELHGADLRGAIGIKANFAGAGVDGWNVAGLQFDKRTVFPNGKSYPCNPPPCFIPAKAKQPRGARR